MNQFFIKILSFLEYLSWGKILIIFEENIATTKQLIKALEIKEDDVVIIKL